MNFQKIPMHSIDKMPEHWRRLVHEYGVRAWVYWIQHEMGEMRGSTYESIKAQLEREIGPPIRAYRRVRR